MNKFFLLLLFLGSFVARGQTVIATDVTASRKLKIPATTAAVTASSGTLKIDTDGPDANITQSVLSYHDGTRIMYGVFVDAIPSTDDHVLAYDGTAKKFVFQAQSGGGSVSDMRTFATMDEMVTASMTGSTNFFLMGYYAPNDGGGGPFYYDALSSSTTNYGMVIKPTGGSGRIIRIINGGIISVKEFGAKGDGVTDDTVRIQQAADEAYFLPGKSGMLYFPPGTYRGSLIIPEFVTVFGATQEGQKNVNEGSSVLKLPDGLTNQDVVTIDQECTLRNMQIDGNKASTSGTSVGINVSNYGIYIESTIEYVSVVNAKTTGINIEANEITIRNCSVIESDGFGIYVANDTWDLTLNKVLVGWSGTTGMYVGTGGSGHRFSQVDVYFSRQIGVELVDPNLTKIDRLQIDFSFLHGLEIECNTGSPAVFIDMPLIYGSNANDDGRGRTNASATGTSSDVIITGTGYPSSITFKDGRIGPILAGALKKPEYVFKWSNTSVEGWGTHFYDVNVDTINGTRVTSGKSMADTMMDSKYWNGRLINYYDGTNALTLVRDTHTFHKHNYVDPPVFTVSSNTVTVTTNIIVTGTGRFGGATAGRTINVDKLGIQIKSDTGETFGISNFGDSFYFGSESSSDPSFQMQGPTGNTTLFSSATRTSSTDKPLKVAYTLNQASGTAGSTGLSIESTSTAVGSGEHSLIKAIDDGLTRLDMRLDGRLVVKSTNGILPHVFGGDSASDSSLYLNFGQTLNRRLNIDGDSIYVALADGTSANQDLNLNEFGGLVSAGGYLRTASGLQYGSATRFDSYGSGSPESIVTADIGSTWRRTDGGASTTFYVKESGNGLNTGWVAYGAAGGSGAPSTADYLVKTADAGLSAERVVTDTTSITADWATGGQAKFVRAALTGDVTAAQNDNATTIANDAVTNAKMANMAASRIKARVTGSTGDPEDATLSQVLDLVGSAANGDMLHRTGGSWARLPAPTQLSGSTLYYGPAGVEWVNPATHYIWREEFLMSVPGTDWSNLNSSGSSGALPAQTGAIGVRYMGGTAVNSYRHEYRGSANNFALGFGRTIITHKIKIPTLGNGTENLTVYVGMYDHQVTPVDGAWFQNDQAVNYGNWQCKVANNSTTTTFNTSTAATTSWVTFTIDVNAGATEVKFYIDGTLVHTESGANIPGNTRFSNVMTGVVKSLGVLYREFYVDYSDVYVKY